MELWPVLELLLERGVVLLKRQVILQLQGVGDVLERVRLEGPHQAHSTVGRA